ncbi:SRPBCC family protein [Sphingomonas sp.]|uniref:SRPBCC family protein n=1 Tax=Sphingomonas sp. TaxID=28214 RepID=UPI001B1E631B|nr:SRPBCC family protein [Sphingomonas sp.]MBO9712752.1 SRPBCC family protein [Sphingomonas sp.]
MTDTPKSSFLYVTYIRTTPERLWEALTDSDFSQQYWLGARAESEWKVGAPWRLVFPDGREADSGEITAFDPPSHLAIRWRNQWSPELNAEGWSLCTMDLEPAGDAVKLTVTHSIERAESKFIGAVSGGWPKILSNLKSLIETGETLMPPKAA